jgi:8-oxo-dGTP diphosphatase
MAPFPVKRVVSCYIMHNGRLLIMRRSSRVGSYRGLWGVAAGHVEPEDRDLEERAFTEAMEETSISRDALTIVSAGDPFFVHEPRIKVSWHVHPFLMESSTDEVRLDWEHTEFRWISPERLGGFDTVPDLEKAFLSLKRP